MNKASTLNLSAKRHGRFSYPWRRIFQTRFLLFVVIAILGIGDTSLRSNGQFWAALSAYFIFIIGMGLLRPALLSLRRIKVIPALADVVLITLLVYITGETSNAWFMLYVFPIVSVSRYLGLEGTLWLASIASLFYFFVSIVSTPEPVFHLQSLIFRCLVLFAIAGALGSLAKARQTDQKDLVAVIEDIDQAFVGSVASDEILKLILKKALELTNSEMGHIRLMDPIRKELRIVAVIGHPEGHDWATQGFDETFSRMAINLNGSLIVPQITRKHLKRHFGTYFRLRRPRPKSACFVPLKTRNPEKLIALIAVYSKWRFHYRTIDARKLEVFTPFIEMAVKSASDQRLRLLYDIGQGLKTGFENRVDLFKRIVNLTADRLGGEEAALFIKDESNPARIFKVEVGGFEDDVAATLRAVETEYLAGTSLTGKVFSSGRPFTQNNVSPKELGFDEYAPKLPSRTIKHYVGAPLVIEGNCLGVIRILNKKAAQYSANERPVLSEVGFRKVDEELLELIASFVAPEIRDVDRIRKLIEAQRYYQNLIVNSPDPIIALDMKGNIVIFNRACQDLWGFSFEEVRNQPVINYYKDEKVAREIGRRLWNSKNHSIENYETEIKDRNGTLIPISLSACFIFEEGKRIGSIGVFKDLREFKNLQEQIIQTAKLAAVGGLARTAGHEIKHKLATAVHFIRPLWRTCDPKKDPELRRVYGMVLDVLSESIDKLQNLLTADKPRTPKKQTFELTDLLQRVRTDIGRQCDDRAIELVLSEPPKHSEVSIDVEQMDQVFGNLFTNSAYAIHARKALEEAFHEGQIKVSTRLVDGQAEIVWTDNGCGISESDLPNVFNAFFTTSSSAAGTGLGLHIVKNIIDGLNGNIRAESELGTGTRMIITLPLNGPGNSNGLGYD